MFRLVILILPEGPFPGSTIVAFHLLPKCLQISGLNEYGWYPSGVAGESSGHVPLHQQRQKPADIPRETIPGLMFRKMSAIVQLDSISTF